MSVQTGLRDLDRNNASDWRSVSLKKGAAPPLHRPSAKSTAAHPASTAAAVHATFISPPRNTPTAVPANPASVAAGGRNARIHGNSGAAVSYASAQPAHRSLDSENNLSRSVYSAQGYGADYVVPSAVYGGSDLAASFPSGASDGIYPGVASAERSIPLRSVSDVPVLSMGCEEEAGRPVAAEAFGHPAPPRGRVTPLPVSRPAPRPVVVAASPEDEIVAAFLASCVGNVAETARTPQGKALLVAALETERAEVLEPVVAEVCGSLGDVAVDAHGCHVVRTLVEACTAEQTEALIAAMYPSVVLNMCTTSQHTRLTLQSLFERRLVDLWPVVEVLAANANYLAATQQGCISLMRVFERCDVEQKAALVHELLPKFATLAMDAFANYMVQCAIEHSDRTTAAQYVVELFAGHLLQMSCDKFASNVVEKVVRVCGGVPAVRRLLLDELVFNPAALKELASDSYGNFVVQAIIEATTNAMELKRVEDRLRPALVGCPFAAKIESKLKAKRPGQSHTTGNGNSNSHSSHHPQQQQQRRGSYAHHNGNAQVYGVAMHVSPQTHVSMAQHPASYRVEPQPMMMAVAGAAPSTGSFRHRPYGSPALSAAEAVQRFQEANAHLRHTPTAQVAVGPVMPAQEFYPLSMASGGAAAVAEAAEEAEDCGPVYGPSPAARRHLQQHQQQFRPPFSGTL